MDQKDYDVAAQTTQASTEDIVLAELEECLEKLDRDFWVIAEKSRYLNSLNPISSLIPEVLVEIFMYFTLNPLDYHMRRTSKYGMPINSKPSVYEWMAVTRVCHHWRETALRTPELWSRIYLGPPDRIQIFLERSDQCPIYIMPFVPNRDEDKPNTDGGVWGYSTMYPPQPSIEIESLKLVFTQIHRIKSLTLREHEHILQPILTDTGGAFEAPLLDTLELFADKNLLGMFFPHSLFSLINLPSPALTNVKIHGYMSPPWELPLFHANLTTLSLRQAQEDSPLSLHSLLITLSEMPGLISLDVQSHYDARPPPYSQSLTHVELPSLQNLTLDCFLLFIEKFVAHCWFPSSAKMVLKSSEYLSGIVPVPQNVDFLLPLSQRGGEGGETVEITSLSISICQRNPLARPFRPFGTGRYIVIEMFSLSRGESIPHFFLEYTSSGMCNSIEILRTLFMGVDLHQVTSITLYCNMDLVDESEPPPVIIRDLGLCMALIIVRCCEPSIVHTLRLSPSCISVLAPLIVHLPIVKYGKKNPYGLFNFLRTLVISDNLVPHSDYLISFEPKLNSALLDAACDVIRHEAHMRKLSGICLPLSTLVFEYLDIDNEWRDELVDSISALVGQEGRFTQSPLQAFPPRFTAFWETIGYEILERRGQLVDDEGNVAKLNLQFKNGWYDVSKVTFDFKGDQGVEIDDDRFIPPPRSGIRFDDPE